MRKDVDIEYLQDAQGVHHKQWGKPPFLALAGGLPKSQTLPNYYPSEQGNIP